MQSTLASWGIRAGKRAKAASPIASPITREEVRDGARTRLLHIRWLGENFLY